MASESEFENHCWRDVISDEMIAHYEGYQRRTFVGPKPALVLIDLYKLVYQGGNRPVSDIREQYPLACGDYAWNAIEPTKRLIAAARRAAIPLIYLTRHVDTNGVFSTKRAKRQKKDPDAYDIWPDFAPQPGDRVIYKERASAFFATPLTVHLRALRVESLIMCGESTSGCVRASAVDAFMHGFQVSLVEECTYDREPLLHKINLFDMHHKYVDVMHVDEVIDHLNGMAANPRVAAE
jgi:maleamate amidohydrolase